jgi:hypothetical protein
MTLRRRSFELRERRKEIVEDLTGKASLRVLDCSCQGFLKSRSLRVGKSVQRTVNEQSDIAVRLLVWHFALKGRALFFL